MSALKSINPSADVISSRHALIMNIQAGKGLADVVKTNLGPRGTMKMLVSGAGLIKVTKDGKVLLDEMQIQHPTAAIIARTATAQDDMTGDGTTSNVLFTGELLSQAERYINEGLHPRVLVDGFELARDHTLKYLDQYKQTFPAEKFDRQLLVEVARTALRTKVNLELADHLTNIVVDAVQTIRKSSEAIDLHMIEIMVMKHQSALDTRFIDGLVLDHGGEHNTHTKDSEVYYYHLKSR
jgi:T-complex protein 1 subunit zeta